MSGNDKGYGGQDGTNPQEVRDDGRGYQWRSPYIWHAFINTLGDFRRRQHTV